jgi:hypothetical protein
MRSAIVLFGLVVLATTVLAQESTNFKLREHSLNAGGQPHDGAVLSSTSFQITLAAVGETVAAVTISGPSFAATEGFVGSVPPPGEVTNLRFNDPSTLAWDPEGSVGDYSLYRGEVTNPYDPGFGSCLVPGITGPTASDITLPAIDTAFFYLVTARNRLGEEGTKGSTSGNEPRGNLAPCS